MDWIGTNLPQAGGAGYAESALPLSQLLAEGNRPAGTRAGLPAIVYFYSVKNDDKLLEYESNVFGDERIGVGSRFFNCFRICLEDIRSASDRKAYGDNEPTVIFLDATGVELARHGGWRVNSATIYRSMERTFDAHYRKDLGKILAKEAKVLEALDRAHWDAEELKTELQEAKEHLERHDCERGRRMVREVTAELAKLEEDRQKALEEEKKLFEIGAPAPADASTGN